MSNEIIATFIDMVACCLSTASGGGSPFIGLFDDPRAKASQYKHPDCCANYRAEARPVLSD
jgi:hypothetical protein